MDKKVTPTWTLSVVVAACLTAPGCLVKETETTLYLDPGGSVTWLTLEKDIRSAEEDPEERLQEEQLFLETWARGEHETAVEMAELGARSVDCQLVRAERPFMVVTTARFVAVDETLQRFFEGLDVRNEAKLERLPEGTRLTWTLWLDEDEAATFGSDDPPELEPEDSSLLRLVLTEGEFVDATGFEIGEGGTVATLPETPEDLAVEEDGAVTLSLTWVAE
jgi:hypothetical protein